MRAVSSASDLLWCSECSGSGYVVKGLLCYQCGGAGCYQEEAWHPALDWLMSLMLKSNLVGYKIMESCIVCGATIHTEDQGKVCNKCYTHENIVKHEWQDSP